MTERFLIEAERMASKESLEAMTRTIEAAGKSGEWLVKTALNKSIDGLLTDVGSSVSARFNVGAGKIKQAGFKYRAGTGGKYSGKRRAGLVFRGKKLPSMAFSPRPGLRMRKQPAVGVSREVEKGSRYTMKGTFIGHNDRGETNVYVRHEGGGSDRYSMAKPGSYPIHQVKSPSIPGVIRMADIQDKMSDKTADRFKKALDHNFNYILTQGKK